MTAKSGIDYRYKYGIVYHDPCVDGFSSAYIAWQYLVYLNLALPEEIKLIPATYQDELNTIAKARDCDSLYIVDFSLPPEYLEVLSEGHVNIRMFDHHKTAIDAYTKGTKIEYRNVKGHIRLQDNINFFYDLEECGASLIYKTLYNTTHLPTWVSYVKDRDLWIKALPHTDEIAAVMQMLPKTIEAYSGVIKELESNFPTVANGGEAILAYKAFLVDAACERAVPITLAGKEGLVTDSEYALASEIGNKLATQSGTYGVLRCGDNYSLRSVGDYDVSEIAKEFGGGGHKNAAGFTLDAAEHMRGKV